MANTTEKLTHEHLGVMKRTNSWLVKFNKNGGSECVPYSVIKSHNPATRTIEIEVWWLKTRGLI